MNDSVQISSGQSGIRFVQDMVRLVFCGTKKSGKSTLLMKLINDIQKVSPRKSDDMASRMGLQIGMDTGKSDLSWHYFSTPNCKFVVVDTPGMDTQVKNLVTSASVVDAAVIVTDAAKGVQTTVRYLTYIVALMGVRNVIHVVNKMDLCDFRKQDFILSSQDFKKFASGTDLIDVTSIPVSAKIGVNLTNHSEYLSWYHGPTLEEALEACDVNFTKSSLSFRMPVQHVGQSEGRHQFLRGTVVSGNISVGSEVRIDPKGQLTTIKQIIGPVGPVSQASCGLSVALKVTSDQKIVRGNYLSAPSNPPIVAAHLSANIVWLDQNPMISGRNYEIRMANTRANARIVDLVHLVDFETLEPQTATELPCNRVGYCNLSVDRELVFDSFADNRHTGFFLLIDKYNNATAGAGIITRYLRKSSNLTWQHMFINKKDRSLALNQKPMVLWFTGLSGAGKTTVANHLEKELLSRGTHTYLIDGDNVRHGLNRDLGFTQEDRVENVRRVAELARLMVDAGLVVIVTLISPFQAERELARELLEPGEFIEIHVSTPLHVCQRRDSKGLYRKASKGELVNLTGIDSVYEVPENPDIIIDCTHDDPKTLTNHIIGYLISREL